MSRRSAPANGLITEDINLLNTESSGSDLEHFSLPPIKGSKAPAKRRKYVGTGEGGGGDL